MSVTWDTAVGLYGIWASDKKEIVLSDKIINKGTRYSGALNDYVYCSGKQ